MDDKQLDRIEEIVYRNQGALAALTDILAMVAKGEACLVEHDLSIRSQRFPDPAPPSEQQNHHWLGYTETFKRFGGTYKVRKFGSPETP
ncbi:MAG: hypothetical protein F4W93_13570 [Dehalococcoidia bacterium]|nr:hypothetical protein [Dehalococcoidia bacterium]